MGVEEVKAVIKDLDGNYPIFCSLALEGKNVMEKYFEQAKLITKDKVYKVLI